MGTLAGREIVGWKCLSGREVVAFHNAKVQQSGKLPQDNNAIKLQAWSEIIHTGARSKFNHCINTEIKKQNTHFP